MKELKVRQDYIKRTGSTDAIVLRKLRRRILPYLSLLYVVAYIDRINISYAALDMNSSLGISSSQYGLVAGIFFCGYALLEVPSNMMLHRFGARKWLARIIILWGLVAVSTGFVQSMTGLLTLRALLGAAEAGFFPGIILYLSYWFPRKYMASAVATFAMAFPFAAIASGPSSTLIMEHIGWFGIVGWRWMFILEGLPAIILGVGTWFVLIDRPQNAHWLSAAEKVWLTERLESEEQSLAKGHRDSGWKLLNNGKVWRLAFVYFLFLAGALGMALWLPSAIKASSKSLTNTAVGILSVFPYIAAMLFMQMWSRHSDKTGERKIHAAISSLIAAIGLFAAAFVDRPIPLLFVFTIHGPFWPLPRCFLTEKSAAVGIAAISSFGALGGFLGPYLVGQLRQSTGNMHSGFLLLASSLIGSAFLLLTMKMPRVQ
jgi:ACS family tartrate transporter-like MFS transporter